MFIGKTWPLCSYKVSSCQEYSFTCHRCGSHVIYAYFYRICFVFHKKHNKMNGKFSPNLGNYILIKGFYIQIVWCSDGTISTFALSSLGLSCKSAKLRRQKCKSKGEKLWKCDSKARRCKCKSAKMKERYYYRSFTFGLSPSDFKLSLLRLTWLHSTSLVNYFEFDIGTVFAKA